MAFKMRGFPFHAPGHVDKRAVKKEEKKDPKTIEKIKELEKRFNRTEILANKGGAQDKLRKLYEKLYPGETYVP